MVSSASQRTGVVEPLTGFRATCRPCHSEYSKQLNEMRLKVLAAKEAAVQDIITDAKARLRDVSKNPSTYKKLLQDLLVQVGLGA